MKCCTECFSSEYLRSIIQSNSSESGNCNFCDSTNVRLYNPRELLLFFRNLLDLYAVSEPTIANPLEIQILSDFPEKIFKISNSESVRQLILSIVEDELESFKELLQSNVYIECLVNPSTKNEASILEVSWEKFVEEIKFENRFHIKNTIDLTKLTILLNQFDRKLIKGKIFYRARISDKNGFGVNEMGNPPRHLTKAGRANPQGISYLYLANDIDTTIFETRAALFDFVSIGDFRLKEDIKIIDLHETDLYDPMYLADKDILKDFIVLYPFVSRLEKEISKPNRRADNELDYLPTQYISEFIKSQGFDGVKYKSSVNPNGYNLAIFNPSKFECIKSYVHEVENVKFEHRKI